MARLIFKCRYMKPGKGAGNYAKYIATREGVEKYVGYIGGRPNSHGLFSDSDEPPVLDSVAKELAGHDGVIFRPVISLLPEDAARLGYDSPKAWQTLLRAHAQTFAEQMGVPLEDLHWYAAYHNEPTHPHCHAVFYSTGRQPYLTNRGIDNIRSALARDIFKQDLMQIYLRQTAHRNDLRQEARELVQQIAAGRQGNPSVDNLLRQLADKLAVHKGKKVYGYLNQPARNVVNAIVDELARDPRIARLYDLWYDQREAVLETYRSDMPERVPLSANSEFKAIKNAIVEEAAKLLPEQAQTATQTARPSEQQQAAPRSITVDVALGSLRLLQHLSRMIDNKIDEGPKQVQVESKLREEIQIKRREQGLKDG